jgi:enoyl-CoA hydratase/carnithine racemase
MEMLFTAELIPAEEAENIGLVARVVPPASLAAEADTVARTMAGKAPLALKYLKEAVNKGVELTLDQGLRLEADLYFLLHTTDDRTEGIRAFQQKRPPSFRGQ